MLKNRSPRFKRYGLISLILILLLCVSLVLRFTLTDICNVSVFAQVDDSRESTPPRPISDSTLTATHQWGINIDLPFQGGILNTNHLIVLSDARSNHVVGLELSSGQEQWATKICDPSTLAHDSSRNRAYAFAGGGSNREIAAFDLDDGEQVWIDFSQNGKDVRLTPKVSRDDELFVYRFPESAIFRVDPDSGAFSEPIAYDPESPSDEYFAVEADLNDIGNDFYWHITIVPPAFEIRSTDDDSVWQVPFPDEINQVEVLDNMFILAFRSRITALEKDTGTRLWSFDGNFASNIAIDDGIVYALDTSANLLMLDVESGEIINHIQFEPSTRQSNRDINESWVGVSENQIAIYFRDIQTLQVLQVE